MDSLLDLDALKQPDELIRDDYDHWRFICEVGMQWRADHGLPSVDPDTAGRLWASCYPAIAEKMEFNLP